jgi:lysophospholipase L1-like esterase
VRRAAGIARTAQTTTRAVTTAMAALAVSAVIAAGIAACTSGPPARHAGPRISYYVSLGDSLSRGMQPNAAGAMVPTSHGYADQLYAALRPGDPGLRLIKLGCSGETTITMIKGGICRYQGGSQLAAAVSFLRAHRQRLSLITIDIGANDFDADLNSCLNRASVVAILSCLKDFAPGTVGDLEKIMTTLRATAGDRVRIIGMSYYVPTLAQWRNGLLGQAVARVSEEAVRGYNRLLDDVYQRYGARVADVFGAFRSTDFSGSVKLPGVGTVPQNVAAICRWTWECAPAPRGPNIHADAAGYRVIARAFLAADR